MIEEPFQRFSSSQRDELRMRYLGDALFRTWSATLCLVEQQLDELGAEEVWSETETIRTHLADLSANRDIEAQFLLRRLTQRHSAWRWPHGGGVEERGAQLGQRTAVVILSVLFTQLADAAPDAAPDALRNPHHALCRVLARDLMHPDRCQLTIQLLTAFSRRRTDNEERLIVLPVTDYLDLRVSADLLDQAARHQVEQMVEDIVCLTRGLLPCLAAGEEDYRQMWHQICLMPGVMELLRQNRPHSANNTWGKNLTLVANVLGIMKTISITQGGNRLLLTGSYVHLSNLLGINVRSYLAFHADFGSSNYSLTKQQHDRIIRILSDYVKRLNVN
ncbi:MAG: hypothetical protein ACI4C3_03785 [Bacteroides sp.]